MEGCAFFPGLLTRQVSKIHILWSKMPFGVIDPESRFTYLEVFLYDQECNYKIPNVCSLAL